MRTLWEFASKGFVCSYHVYQCIMEAMVMMMRMWMGGGGGGGGEKVREECGVVDDEVESGR